MSKVVTGLRPGGRSARIQEAVHQAVLALQHEVDAAQLNVPAIAKKAGVTPSTIYRRWGSLSALLADVALAKLQPDALPQDYGSFKADLYAWVEQYFEEYTSCIGLSLLTDIASDPDHREECYSLVNQQLNVIRDRAIQRKESYIENSIIIEMIVSPIIYMILFSKHDLDIAYVHKLLERLCKYQGLLTTTER
ncbi:TetR/AcrR family transcriptional regulator [Acinetobacter larvae]|uniref:TetR family transcriptional regulator n=1 Tax=Acinetobacter larvae TaxID=1789224 RepID=A0A1B2M0R7_9GAMM|nr:TetR/AcrR family transcriptional regulator [Acinetobacter larvae]AOA58787.1 TetR family transcriptional regulator [Acinetobacter larvae]